VRHLDLAALIYRGASIRRLEVQDLFWWEALWAPGSLSPGRAQDCFSTPSGGIGPLGDRSSIGRLASNSAPSQVTPATLLQICCSRIRRATARRSSRGGRVSIGFDTSRNLATANNLPTPSVDGVQARVDQRRGKPCQAFVGPPGWGAVERTDRPGKVGPLGPRVCDPYELAFAANSRGVRPSRER
jgi:hypothetical protein